MMIWLLILLLSCIPAVAQQFKGRVIVKYLPTVELHRICRAPMDVALLGCAMGGAVQGFGVGRDTCMVYAHEKVRGASEAVIAHEIAHCAGWRH